MPMSRSAVLKQRGRMRHRRARPAKIRKTVVNHETSEHLAVVRLTSYRRYYKGGKLSQVKPNAGCLKLGVFISLRRWRTPWHPHPQAEIRIKYSGRKLRAQDQTGLVRWLTTARRNVLRIVATDRLECLPQNPLVCTFPPRLAKNQPIDSALENWVRFAKTLRASHRSRSGLTSAKIQSAENYAI